MKLFQRDRPAGSGREGGGLSTKRGRAVPGRNDHLSRAQVAPNHARVGSSVWRTRKTGLTKECGRLCGMSRSMNCRWSRMSFATAAMQGEGCPEVR
ncbi:uncharacterized protein BDZ83DRAFT_409706 [Colletotrichum acutatum]|uniref:Uncharacterized protein n=1 Tax=Glomerella acutata TaxID=27357 RepID=A0AAD8XCR3_GLOAC|nr:uncharacterized protein BDZ83DRAFT_409706 [Colletotrichum acutatum]KAK1722939.1 hypothetical protein BDZ83DRAFT_409706 [Colletotrichum acutatum]